MRCLVVGGTGFLGGAITDTLLEAGHAVAVLTRGNTPRSRTPAVEAIQADRHSALDALQGRPFDWVFDTCSYTPDAVRPLLEVLGETAQRYCMISSVSAYGCFSTPQLDETATAPTATDTDYALAARLPPEERSSAIAYGASYGPLKRACEMEAERLLGNRATALRVGLLVGAGDYSDRLTWWIRRLDCADDFPAPAPPHRMVQMIDVRDAAEFALRCAEQELSGIWNVTGTPQSFSTVLAEVTAATGSAARPVWVSEDAIVAAGLAPWSEVPLMAPALPNFRHFMNVSTQKAQAAGLSCRPLSETLAPLLTWDRARRTTPLKCGISRDQEAQLLNT